MDTKNFIQIMRKIIREEVQTAVRNEFANVNASITESKRPIVATKTINTAATKKPAAKPYTKNAFLNEILNSTTGFRGEGPAVMLEEQFVSQDQINYNDFSEWPSMQRSVTPSVIPTTDADGRRVDLNQLSQTEAGAAVVDALTKDYSSLMKAINKKKGLE